MLELLQTFGSKAKSAQSSIESNELDIVFEHYTQKYQVEDFGFDKKASESKKEKKSAKKVEETVETVEEIIEDAPIQKKSRYVDTRTVSVDLEKFDTEKIEELVPQNIDTNKTTKKQKIKKNKTEKKRTAC